MTLDTSDIFKDWALFLDRDGVINKRIVDDYVKSWADFVFCEGAIEALKFFNTHFWEDVLKNGSRNKFNNQKKLYYKKLGLDNLHANIRKIIERRTKYLKCVHIPTITKVETAQVKIVFNTIL